MSEPACKASGSLSLTEPVLFWVCNDTSNLVAATISQHLKSENRFLSQRLPVEHLGSSNVGLVVCAILEPQHFSTAIAAILQARKQNSRAMLLVFLIPELLQYRSALIEAGAHLVITEVHQIPAVLSKCAGDLILSREGMHPITSGLVSRLPWANLDES